MITKTDFSHTIREIENTWIPLADGTRLAARIWLPADAEQHPVPALFEYIPYRKSDGTAVRDALRQPYFAGHGYAAIRVDIRGSGESDGILYDEYLQQEQDDALEILEWIASQPWCDGNIGMHGISWGGFNALQVAARRPPQLKALLVIGFTDDRYNDDVHYMGGCLLTRQMLNWASAMFLYNGAPPDPRFVGDRWREMWLERLEKTPPYIEAWLTHQRRDEYWKHGSVGENYAAIQIPVYAVGGWADAYNNSVPRLLAQLNAPRKGLIGPWCHTFPEMGVPGPAIGFLQESVRWWDHWLKGIDTGIMDEPMFRVWVQDSVPPATHYTHRPGRWVAEPGWPSPHTTPRQLWLNSNGAANWLAAEQTGFVPLSFRGVQTHGFESGEWGAYAVPGDFAGDQRRSDGEALTFDSAPVAAPEEIVGYPTVTVTVAADRPLALLAARLCDVAPTGESLLVSYGLLNLAQRESQKLPQPLTPGEPVTVTVQLNVCAHRLVAGHRWRLSLSPTYLRHAWPSPVPATLTLVEAPHHLTLPIRPPQPADDTLPSFLPPEQASPLPVTHLSPGGRTQTLSRDLATGAFVFTSVSEDGCLRYENGMEINGRSHETIRITEGDPLSLVNEIRHESSYQRGDWCVAIHTHSKMSSTATHFHVTNLLEAYEDSRRVFHKARTFTVPRDFL